MLRIEPTSDKQETLSTMGTRTSVKKEMKSQYSSYFEIQLPRRDYGKSREDHFNICNGILLEKLKQLNRNGIQLCAEVSNDKLIENLKNNKRRNLSPDDFFSWEHCSTSTVSDGRMGVMRLVPRSQHKSGSEHWRAFHPDFKNRGGYHEWAVPHGAPAGKKRAILKIENSPKISLDQLPNYFLDAVKYNNFEVFSYVLNEAQKLCKSEQLLQILTQTYKFGKSGAIANLLHLACANGNPLFINVLMRYGSNVSSFVHGRDNMGNTPAHIAAGNSRDSVLRNLSAKGVDLSLVNNRGETVSHIVDLRKNYSAQTSKSKSSPNPKGKGTVKYAGLPTKEMIIQRSKQITAKQMKAKRSNEVAGGKVEAKHVRHVTQGVSQAAAYSIKADQLKKEAAQRTAALQARKGRAAKPVNPQAKRGAVLRSQQANGNRVSMQKANQAVAQRAVNQLTKQGVVRHVEAKQATRPAAYSAAAHKSNISHGVHQQLQQPTTKRTMPASSTYKATQSFKQTGPVAVHAKAPQSYKQARPVADHAKAPQSYKPSRPAAVYAKAPQLYKSPKPFVVVRAKVPLKNMQPRPLAALRAKAPPNHIQPRPLAARNAKVLQNNNLQNHRREEIRRQAIARQAVVTRAATVRSVALAKATADATKAAARTKAAESVKAAAARKAADRNNAATARKAAESSKAAVASKARAGAKAASVPAGVKAAAATARTRRK